MNLYNLYYDSSGAIEDPIKKVCLKMLKDAYPDHELFAGRCTSDSISNHELAQGIKGAERVFIWNGSEVGCFWVIELCKRYGTPYCILERGLFPQGKTNFMIDAEGICCRSKNLEPLHLVERESSVKKFEEALQSKPNLKPTKKGKICIVLQLEFDSTVYHYSPWKTNNDFIKYIEQHFGITASEMVICPHPRNKNFKHEKFRVSEKSTVEECLDAEIVVGVSSTVLYELDFLGINSHVYGSLKEQEHPLNRGFDCQRDLTICILDNQVDPTKDSIEEIRQKLEYSLNL